MNVADFIPSIKEAVSEAKVIGGEMRVGVMIRGASGEWEFIETPKPQLRYDHKTGKPLLILGRVVGTLAKP